MQAVILAAGRGTRMVELTEHVPKPMLMVQGQPLLEYKLRVLPDEIDEVIFIIGYHGHVIREYFGAHYNGRNIRYVEQEELNGTAGALWSAQKDLHDRFLIMMGDDIYAAEDIVRCIEPSSNWKLLAQELPVMHRAGSVQIGEDGNITGIVESKEEDDARVEPGIASTNLYVLDTRLFSYPLVRKHEGSLEYGLPQTVVAASKALGITFEAVFTDKWLQITSPKDLVFAAEILKKIAK